MHLSIRVVAFENDAELVHGLLVRGKGRDLEQAPTTCCGRETTPERRLAVYDGHPITCRDCLTALASGVLRFLTPHPARSESRA